MTSTAPREGTVTASKLASKQKQEANLVQISLVRKKGSGHENALDEVTSDYMRSVLDAFPFYVMLIDAEHRILCANEAVRTTLGVEPDEILGGYCPTIVHGSEGPYAGCPLEKARRIGKAVEIEYHDAKINRILNSGIYPTAYETAPGHTVYLHTVRDVTEQRTVEQKVRRAHDAQRFVNDVLRLSLQDISLDEILDHVVERLCEIPWLSENPQAAVMLADEKTATLRLKTEHTKGKGPKACEVVPFGKCLCGRAAVKRAPEYIRHAKHGDAHELSRGGEDHGHYCLPIIHGELLLGVLNVGLDDDHARCEGELDFLSAVADTLASVIQRKRVEELQRRHHSVAVARERMARVGELSAGVAHTVRNPLHGVMSCVDILDGNAQNGDPVPADIVALMRDGLERIERVTRRLLSLTRGGRTERCPTSVGSLLADLVDFTAIQAEKRGVQLRLEADFGGEALLSMDGVVEGLSSVISNALDACEPGRTITIRSFLRSDARALVLEVADNGSGISAEDLPRVMDPFYTTKPIGEGSGLGLAITKRVMYDHDGEVEIASEAGKGTTVRLVFPGALLHDSPAS
jgi:signal transduction histidine kinase/PAS domain-containing protein